MVSKYTSWRLGTKCLLVSGKHGKAKIPIAGRLVCSGVTLSYGAFEMQSVQYRVGKAN